MLRDGNEGQSGGETDIQTAQQAQELALSGQCGAPGQSDTNKDTHGSRDL